MDVILTRDGVRIASGRVEVTSFEVDGVPITRALGAILCAPGAVLHSASKLRPSRNARVIAVSESSPESYFPDAPRLSLDLLGPEGRSLAPTALVLSDAPFGLPWIRVWAQLGEAPANVVARLLPVELGARAQPQPNA